MKEIFIIKDCFDSYEEIHKHFLTKATKVSVLSYEEATNLNSSKSNIKDSLLFNIEQNISSFSKKK